MTSPVVFDDAVSRPGRLPSVGRLAGTAAMLAILAGGASLLNLDSWRYGGVTVLWPTNGLLLGILLCAPRRQWASYLMLGYIIDAVASVATGSPLPMALYLACCNMLEVGLAAGLLHKRLTVEPDLTNRKQLTSFLVWGVGLAAAVASLLSVLYDRPPLFSAATLLAFQRWYVADAMGIAIVTPLYLSFRQNRRFAGHSGWEIGGLFSLLTGVTLLVFWQARFPLLFFIFPFLLLLGARLRLAGSALGLLIVSMIGGWFTVAGHGPLVLVPQSSLALRVLVLQSFLASCMAVLYVTEVVISEREGLQEHLEESEGRFRLLAEVSRDVIVMFGLDGTRKYVSPAVTEVLGWDPAELMGDTSIDLFHPDEVAKVKARFAECLEGPSLEAMSYRCRKRDGSYLWMESNLRLYRDAKTGEPVGFVNVVRDISSRKAADEELQKAFRLVEELAASDALTGIANRRRLDSTLDGEWRRAIRNRLPLSLLMMDVDHFKRYNDLYGHLHGDNCLRQIAAVTAKIVHRPGDLLARYGGEEFAVVLSGTDSEGAHTVAEQIRKAVAALGLSHRENPHLVVTVSIGCATMVPELNAGYEMLVDAADNALYQAKSLGRNRSEVSEDHTHVARSSSGARLVFP